MDPEKKKALGLKLLIARRAMNLTQSDVAGRIGIHQTHYLRIEKGLVGISTVQLFKLCGILNIDLNEILEAYFGFGARNDSELLADVKVNKLIYTIRITEDEIKKRDRKIAKLKSEINGLLTHGYGISP